MSTATKLCVCLIVLMVPCLASGQNLLDNPESVVYDSTQDRYLVSNYGGREIIQVDFEGNHSVFYAGLPAPRGLLIHRGVLYAVSDTGVTGHSLATSEITWHVDVPTWTFPNDVIADSSDFLYVTDYIPDTQGGGVYRLNISDSSSVYLAGPMDYPNGITYDNVNNRLLTCGGYPSARVSSISLPDGVVSVAVYTPFSALDGIVIDLAGNVYVSGWTDDAIYRYGPELTNPPALYTIGHPDPADIFYDRTAHLLGIPNFSENTVDFVPVTADQFEAVADGVIVSDGGGSQGVSWADYDHDDYADMFVSNLIYPSGEDNCIYRNDGYGNFEKVTSGGIVTDGGYTRTSTWGDFDNDGDLDVFAANWPDQVNFLYQNDGIGSFSRVYSGSIATEVNGSPAAAWADYDNDGLLDLFVANYGTNSLFRNNGTGFEKTTSGTIATDVSDSYGASWADIDNDGDMDLFVPTPAEGSSDKDNYAYVNNGDGTFSSVASDIIVSDGGLSFGGSWGDYDNDGDLDLFVSNVGLEGNFLYNNDGDGNFTKILTGSIVNDGGNSFGSCWGDYDNDGDLDLFVSNATEPGGSGEDFLYSNNGDGTFERITDGTIAVELADSYGSAWADYDRDGDLDLMVARLDGADNVLYRNTGNRNSWINIHLVGSRSNRSAIGARVRVVSSIDGEQTRQMREISSQTGYCGQNSLNAHFGLGDSGEIDSVVVRWPSGWSSIMTGVEVNQFLTITEQCCGAYNGGFTGNANCSTDGKCTLGDITRLIDHVYISKQPLCCEGNGNVNGSVDGMITLSDITRLIDHVYISKANTETCLE